MSGHQSLHNKWSLHEPNRVPPDSSSMKAQRVDGKRRRPATRLVRPGTGGSSEGSTKLLQADFYPTPPTELPTPGRRIEAQPPWVASRRCSSPETRRPTSSCPTKMAI